MSSFTSVEFNGTAIFSRLDRRNFVAAKSGLPISPMPLSAKGFARTLPDCKIICTFRDPATRLYSQYRLLRRGRPWNGRLISSGIIRLIVHWGGDLCGYATQLRRWQETFGKHRVLVLFYEDLMSDPQDYLNQVCDYIGTPRFPLENSPMAT